ncbi:MAG: hypothetical protein ACREN2_00730 [Candidatus Dormibacteria bacterium]
MTTLLTIAEVLAGEALVSPGGPIDRATALGDDQGLWSFPTRAEAAPTPADAAVSVLA